MQTLQQTLVDERDKIVQNANQQRSMLEESLHSTKSEEQRLRTKLAEAEEVGLLTYSACFFLLGFSPLSIARIKTNVLNEIPRSQKLRILCVTVKKFHTEYPFHFLSFPILT